MKLWKRRPIIKAFSVPGELPSAAARDLHGFKHRPLRLELDEIRLCKLLAYQAGDSQDHEIRLHVEHFPLLTGKQTLKDDYPLPPIDAITSDPPPPPLPQSPPYRALSYTWGSLEGSHLIMVNDRSFHVSGNLHSFLDILRIEQAGQESGWYFIDQICIDQGNVSERNHQVQNMGSIFAVASAVHVWLGPASDASPVALDMLYRYDEWYLRQERFRGSMDEEFGDSCQQWELNALRALMERPYWSRLWIVQELFHAKVIIFRCGLDKFQASYGTLFSTGPFKNLLERAIDPSYTASYVIGYNLLWRMIDGTCGSYRPLSLHAALTEFMESHCKEPRDRVFGLLGCVKIEQRTEIDYCLDVSTVFLNAIETICQSPERGFLLSPAYASELERQFKKLRTKMGLDNTICDESIKSTILKSKFSPEDDEAISDACIP